MCIRDSIHTHNLKHTSFSNLPNVSDSYIKIVYYDVYFTPQINQHLFTIKIDRVGAIINHLKETIS